MRQPLLELGDQSVIRGMAAVVALSGVRVDHVELRVWPQRLGNRSFEAGIRGSNASGVCGRGSNLAVQNGEALRDCSERGQVARIDLVVVEERRLQMLTDDCAVSDFGNHRATDLPLDGQV